MITPQSVSEAAIEPHTELPWGIERTADTNWIGPLRANGKAEEIVCFTDREELRAPILRRNDANAEFIVRACNHHQELVDALRSLVELIDPSDITPEGLAECHALLVKATGR